MQINFNCVYKFQKKKIWCTEVSRFTQVLWDKCYINWNKHYMARWEISIEREVIVKQESTIIIHTFRVGTHMYRK